MDKKELINELAKCACNACEMGDGFDGDCHDLIGEYTTWRQDHSSLRIQIS